MPTTPWATSNRRTQLPNDWRQRRRQALTRDGHRCTWTDHGRRCPNPATDVDHRTPGNDHRLTNLQSLCADHHKRKTQAEAAAARQRIAARARRPPEPHPGLLDPR